MHRCTVQPSLAWLWMIQPYTERGLTKSCLGLIQHFNGIFAKALLWNHQTIETEAQQFDVEQTPGNATEEALQYKSAAILIARDVNAHASEWDCYSREYDWA
eukprot:12701842-Ditylum_brightwellii.AAC.1